MSSASAFAIILAGGGGTRLWPASRRRTPNSSCVSGGDESLLGARRRGARAVLRSRAHPDGDRGRPGGAVARAVPSLPPRTSSSSRSRATPPPPSGWARSSCSGAPARRRCWRCCPRIRTSPTRSASPRSCAPRSPRPRGAIATIGIKPTHAETGFGYIRLGRRSRRGRRRHAAVHQVGALRREAGSRDRGALRRPGDYLWNSGMFFFTAGRLLEEARRHLPALGQTLDAIERRARLRRRRARALPVGAVDLDRLRRHGEGGRRCASVPGDFGWNDVGSWAALRRSAPADADGNVVVGERDADRRTRQHRRRRARRAVVGVRRRRGSGGGRHRRRGAGDAQAPRRRTCAQVVEAREESTDREEPADEPPRLS